MNNLESLVEKISEFEEIIGYKYKDVNNAVLALTHSSYANENKTEKIESNERLEFLGDAVLNIVISEYIYKKFPGLTEGEMTKLRSHIVCEPSLKKCSNNISAGKFLLLGKGEELTGGRTRISILSDAFEALIGSIYIDSGLENVKKFIFKQMKKLIEDCVSGIIFMDYKTQLQEVIQKNSESRITYEIVEEKGPDHNKLFISQVVISGEVMGLGEGRSKKEAEQNAARAALNKVLD